jgi:hypothetical protein
VAILGISKRRNEPHACENWEQVDSALTKQDRRVSIQGNTPDLHIPTLRIAKGTLKPERIPNIEESEPFEEGRNYRGFPYSRIKRFDRGRPKFSLTQSPVEFRLWPDAATDTEPVAVPLLPKDWLRQEKKHQRDRADAEKRAQSAMKLSNVGVLVHSLSKEQRRFII